MRKKKKLYDGRTRVAKKFVERILKQRESRKVTEEVELDEYDKKGIDKEIRKSRKFLFLVVKMVVKIVY